MTKFVPSLVSWNITRRCNLNCAHCYLDARARESSKDELTGDEARLFIDQLAALSPGAMMVFSGGEPLLRPDLPDLVAYASGRGLLPVLGTNGVLLTDTVASKLADRGLAGVGLSLDSLDPARHDAFRGVPGAWRKTVTALDACHHAGLSVQIHTTATGENYHEIPELIAWADDHAAVAFHLFFLVCTGRGEQLTDISPTQYEAALSYLLEAEKTYRGRMMIRARCAPYFLRFAKSRNPEVATIAAGCLAGKTYLRVTPEGELTPCPYLPLVVGSLKVDSLAGIWNQADVLQRLRDPQLRGRCGICEFDKLCGGCRARAYASEGDLLAEDPWCEYQPAGTRPELGASGGEPVLPEPAWTAEARARLARVPAALRHLVEKSVVAYAKSKGASAITPEIMAEVRARTGLKRPLGLGKGPPT
jgi:radical SAM protein with 4Fe4S-binding SPASM domain